jgi:hypothetical protein
MPLRDAIRDYRSAVDTKRFLTVVEKMKENNFDTSEVHELENDLREMNENIFTEFEKVRILLKTAIPRE